MSARQFKIFVFLLLGVLAAYKIWFVLSLNGLPDPNGDAAFEPLHLNSGRGFFEQGFTSHCGLPQFHYVKGPEPQSVYSHYPPGPDWSVGAMMHICGPANVGCIRAWPLALGIASLGYFFFSLPLVIPFAGAAIIAAITVALPMTRLHLHGLAYWGYPFALLLLQLGLIFHAISRRKWSWPHWLAYGGLSFLQGWFSYDFAFVSIFLPVPFWLMFPKAIPFRTWFNLVFMSGSMFTLAFILHFAQNICFFGGLQGAIDDYRQIAETRMSGKGVDLSWVKPEQLTFLNTTRLQIDVFISKKQNFGHPAQIIFIIAAVLGLFNFRNNFRMGQRNILMKFNRQDAYAIFVALAIACLWSFVMTQHAYIHQWTARHFFLPYLVGLMVFARSISVSKPNEVDSH